MKIVSRARLGVSLLAIIQIATAGAALAQVASSTKTTDASSPEDSYGEIVVTAQRRDESLQDVPISLTVVGGENLEENAIANLTDLAARIPNFNFQRAPGAQSMIMRGIGSGTGNNSLEQSVSIFVDGIYGGQGRQFNAPFLDIERLEVLRGPQGALVGKNTIAGAINILTRRPEQQFGGFVNALYDFGFRGPSIDAGVNVPLAPGLAIRVVGQYTDQNGYLYNTLTQRHEATRKEYLGRVSLAYEDGPTKLFAKYEHNDLNTGGTLLQLWSPSTDRPLAWRKATRAADGPEIDNLTTNNAVVQLDFDIDWATLSTITGYSGFHSVQHIDADFADIEAAISDFNMDMDQYSQEFRLVSQADGPFDYAGGLLFQENDLVELRSTGALRTPNTSNYRVFDQKTRDVSVYGQAGYNFGDFRLQGSLRYTYVRKSATYKRYTGPLALQFIAPQDRDIFGAQTNHLLDPSATLQYRPTESLMLYVSYQHGSKSGGFQSAIANAAQNSFAFLPETSTSYEFGTKFDLRRMGYVNLTAFHTTYNNLQVTTAQPAVAGTTPFFTGNAGRARVIGLELDSLVRLTPEFELAVGGAWNPTAKFLEFPAGPCGPGQVPNGTRPGSCNNAGLRLQRTSRLQGSVTAAYKRDLSDDLRLSTSVTTNYQSKQRKKFDEDPRGYQGAYAKIDARIAVGASDESWELAVVGRNLTDILTISNNDTGGLGAPLVNQDPRNINDDARNVILDPPRQIVLTASFKF